PSFPTRRSSDLTGDAMIRSAARTEARSRKRAKTTKRGPSHSKAERSQRSGERPLREEDVTVFLPLVRQVVQQIQAALPASIEHDEVMSWGVRSEEHTSELQS